MNPVSPALARPLAAATALAAVSSLRAGDPVVPLPPVPDPTGFAGAFAGVEGTMLVAGGGANFPDGKMPWEGGKKVWHDRLFALDLSAEGAAWREIGRLPEPNGYGLSLTTEEGVLLIGGGNAERHFATVRRMRLGDGKPDFESLPSLPEPLAQMAGVLAGRRVHVCGGIRNPGDTRASAAHRMLDLDAVERGWQELPPLPAAGRILATAGAVGEDWILAGGCSLAADAEGKPVRTYLREVWRFSAGKWKRLADMPRAAVAAASPAPARGGSLYVISGDDGSQTGLPSPAAHRGFTGEILRYDSRKDAWSVAGELEIPAPVTLPTAPWKDGHVLFNGELKPGVRTPQVFLFTPPEKP